MSIQVVPSQTRCEMMRESSIAITRSTLQRSVISMPNNRSAPSTKATLLPRVQVVLAIGPRDDLVVLAVLADLLEPAVQVADVRDAADDRLAIELEHEPEHAMRGRVLRADVDEHVLGVHLRLGHHPGLERDRLAAQRERCALRPALGVESRRGEGDFDRARGLTRPPVRPVLHVAARTSSRLHVSGKASNASAMDSSSIE